MAVSAAQLASLSPGVDPELIQQHLARLDGRYFARFAPEEVAGHLAALSGLTAERPVSVTFLVQPSGDLACTVLAFDHSGAFSLIAGVLSSMGFDIRSGDIFTWAPARPDSPRSLALRRRRIIDHFTGTVAVERYNDDWQQALENRLAEVFAGLERGGDAAVTARRAVNEMAARALGQMRLGRGAVLYPVQIEMAQPEGAAGASPERTHMRVISQDTPFFLFTFATALTLQEVSIEHVTIRTSGGRIEDEFEFVDAAGRAITDPARVDRIKLSVLLTKQFTTFLESAPDPLAALTRFEQLVKEVIATPTPGGSTRGTASEMTRGTASKMTRGTASNWLELLSDRDVMRDLAQLLGASTFLWEDFVRSQYEELLPMLVPSVHGKGFVEPIELLPERLEMALAGAENGTGYRGGEGEEEFARRLNEFKDREIYLFDLDHILNARDATDAEAFGSDFLTLSRRLTALAENIVEAAAAFAWRALRARFGEPRTVAGLPVRYAIMGLGKMGGVALGYASDIELLFVYSDSGSTEGTEKIDNSEFFDRLVREVLRLVHAKREGIFHIDLRLRPFGAAGPLGCSLETFCTYYARGGPAHSYERLSLVRLRGVGGDRSLGRQVERLRDEMVYSAQSIDMAEVRALRARQVQEKSRPGVLNAKFSPGALVDLEYAVQILQVMHGAAEKRLRTPRIHEALEALASIGVLEQSEAVELVRAYHFFRHLINGLRMLRGSAQDLFLPVLDSDEYLHLARRMGYTPEPEITPAQKLHLDFETHTAEVRAFVERHFGRDSLSGGPAVTVADIVLSDAVPEDQARATLSEHGFSDPARALLNLRRIGGEAERRTLFARLAILACDLLVQRPDPDMALNNWERFLHALDDPQAHLRQMLSQPMRLEILLSIFSASQFLADTMVRDPSLLDYIGRPDVIRAPRAAGAVADELRGLSAKAVNRDQWRDALRVMRRREILRIGARDICLGTATQRIMEELSDLADAMIAVSLERIRSSEGRRDAGFCVIAFGKLGGRELNYSSDIDLLGLCDPRGDPDAVEQASRDMEALRADLSVHTAEGYAYRVDLRLRPYGSSGQLVYPLDALVEYYGRTAALWELQALLKARPVAGDLSVGRAFLDSTRALLTAPHQKSAVAASIDRLRREALKALSRSILSTTDIKTGLGGLRDVEFLAQGLQMVHAHEKPGLLCGGTLPALKGLGEAGILAAETAEQLSGDYLFLRRVEHFLQIYEDRQTHSLPRDPSQLRALARLMLGSGATSEQLMAKLEKRFERIQGEYRKFAGEAGAG